MSASYRDRMDWTRQQISRLLPKGGKVLDIGCDISLIACDRTDTTFVDNRPYEELAENAAKLGQPIFPKERFVQADAPQLPFQDGEFDIALLTEILEHVEDPVAVLIEAQRVGKRIVLSVPNEFEWDKNLKPFCNPVHVRHYTRTMLEEHLAAAGLSSAIEKLAYDDGGGRIWVFWLAVAVKAGAEEIMLIEELPGAEPTVFDNPEYWCGELGYRPGPFKQGYFDFPIHELKVEYIMQKYQPKKVLDIGCAMGFIVKRFRDKGVNAWGMDISAYALGKAPEDVRPFLGKESATSLPWRDKYFDVGVSFGVLEHLSPDDVVKAIREIKRVCQRGLIAVGTSEDVHFDTDKTHRTKMPLEWWQKQFGEGWEVVREDAKVWVDMGLKVGLDWCVQKMSDFAEKELHALKLKIGIISGPLIPVPPAGYGGMERVVYDLAVALGQDGHDVTLFAPDESHAEHCKLVGFGPAIMDVKCDWVKAERDAFQKVREQIVSDGFQILHSNTWFGFAYQARLKNPAIRVCHTHHGHIDPRWWKSSTPPFPMNLIGISKHMAAEYAQLGLTAHPVYNGIDMRKYAFQKQKGDRLIYVGRASNFKQPHVAIEVAKKLGMGIDMVCGTFVDSDDYMKQLKASCDGQQVRWVEDPPQDEKVKLMQNAKCLLFPSKMCIPAGFTVLANPDAKAIENVHVGDLVLSHDGSWNKVTDISSRPFDGELTEVIPYALNLPIRLTGNHRMFSAKRDASWASRMTPSILRDQPNSIKINDPDWVPSALLKEGDFVALPISSSDDREMLDIRSIFTPTEIVEVGNKLYPAYYNPLIRQITRHGGHGIPKSIQISPKFLRLLGYYVAEGSRCGSSIHLSFGKHDANLIQDAEGILDAMEFNYSPARPYPDSEVIVHSVLLAKVFERWFGRGAVNKHLPRWLCQLPPEKLWPFIEGAWKGDGCTRHGNGYDYFEYSTASKTLAIQLWLMLAKCGIIAQFAARRQNSNAFGHGKPIYRLTITGKFVAPMSESIHVPLTGKLRKRPWHMAFFYKDWVYLPIRKISRMPFEGKVYNLEVEGSQSFMCESTMVHNSEPFGLVAAESMACGTPVVALRDGAIAEVVADGETGYVCDSTGEMCAAVKRIENITPEACRQRVERCFSREVMATMYLKEYRSILAGEEW